VAEPAGGSDAEWVAGARAGSDAARTALVRRHHAGCLRFARHLLGDDADADDAVQETFIRAFAALGRYDERDAFRAWLFGILVNRCRTLAARRSSRRRWLVAERDARRDAPVPGHAAALDAQRNLVRALAGLDLPHREAFLLRVCEEMEYDEMARLTGVAASALRMRVKRARDHVRANWGEVANGF
jgi:RNA polymerase sigma-70 factor (ECF subfamily)